MTCARIVQGTPAQSTGSKMFFRAHPLLRDRLNHRQMALPGQALRHLQAIYRIAVIANPTMSPMKRRARISSSLPL